MVQWLQGSYVTEGLYVESRAQQLRRRNWLHTRHTLRTVHSTTDIWTLMLQWNCWAAASSFETTKLGLMLQALNFTCKSINDNIMVVTNPAIWLVGLRFLSSKKPVGFLSATGTYKTSH